jgi:hypothetical protein
VFDLLYGRGNSQTDGTWDPTAMYYALYGTDDVYTLAGAGGFMAIFRVRRGGESDQKPTRQKPLLTPRMTRASV